MAKAKTKTTMKPPSRKPARFADSTDAVMTTAAAEIATLPACKSFAELLDLFAAVKAASDATNKWGDEPEGPARDRSYFRALVEAQKFLHVRNMIARQFPGSAAEAVKSLEILGEALADIDEGEMWAAWACNVAMGVSGSGNERAWKMALAIGANDDEQMRSLDRGIGALHTLASTVSQSGDDLAINIGEIGNAALYLAEQLRGDFNTSRENLYAAMDLADPDDKPKKAAEELACELDKAADLEKRAKEIRARVGAPQ